MGHSRPLYSFIFVFLKVNSKYDNYKIVPMTGFKPRTSGMRRDCSTNWVTTKGLILVWRQKQLNHFGPLVVPNTRPIFLHFAVWALQLIRNDNLDRIQIPIIGFFKQMLCQLQLTIPFLKMGHPRPHFRLFSASSS